MSKKTYELITKPDGRQFVSAEGVKALLSEAEAREKILLDALECYRWIHAHTLNKDRICYVAKEAIEKYNQAKAGSEG